MSPFPRRRGQALLRVVASVIILATRCACQKVLVLLQDTSVQHTHRQFLEDVRSLGLELDVRTIDDNSLRLQRWGKWLYEGVLILADSRTKDLGGALDAAYVSEFLDAGGSVFLAAGPDAHVSLRNVAAEMGADFVAPGAELQDHVSFAMGRSAGSVITYHTAQISPLTGNTTGPVLFEGTALTTAPDVALTTVVLRPAATATIESEGRAIMGPQLALAVATQTRANARAVVVASLRALSDAAYEAAVTRAGEREGQPVCNRALARHLAMWTFQLAGVLRTSALRHARTGHTGPPPGNTYTVSDEITLELDIEERWLDEWRPHASGGVQADFVMLDPYVRQFMSHDGRGRFFLTVRAPDKYGVFKWVVDYKAPGYSSVHEEAVTPLRPLKHNEYPRFIAQAFPYYAALVCLSVAFAVLVTFVMYHQ